MKLEQTIQYMYDFYPDLFPNRRYALNHLFLTIGNGMVWHDGQLIDKDFENLDYNNEVIFRYGNFGNNYKITVPEVAKAQQETVLALNFVDRVFKDNPNYKFKWYGQNDNNEIISSMTCIQLAVIIQSAMMAISVLCIICLYKNFKSIEEQLELTDLALKANKHRTDCLQNMVFKMKEVFKDRLKEEE